MRDIPAFIEAAATRGRGPKYAELLAFCEQSGFSPGFFCNEFSILVAKGFADGKLAFEFCDEAMNYLLGFMTTPPVLGPDQNIPEPAFAIFQAFDEGEYYHSGDSREVEPMEKYTRPMINWILLGLRNGC